MPSLSAPEPCSQEAICRSAVSVGSLLAIFFVVNRLMELLLLLRVFGAADCRLFLVCVPLGVGV